MSNKREKALWADGLPRTCGHDLGNRQTCAYTTYYRNNMSQHKKFHQKNIVYTCDEPECSFKTKSQRSFQQHKHSMCNTCGLKFTGDQAVSNHKKLHPTQGKSKSFLFTILSNLFFSLFINFGTCI